MRYIVIMFCYLHGLYMHPFLLLFKVLYLIPIMDLVILVEMDWLHHLTCLV